jgi:hypothetical protein
MNSFPKDETTTDIDPHAFSEQERHAEKTEQNYFMGRALEKP